MLNIHIQEGRPLTKTVALEGRLDTDTAGEFDKELEFLLGTAVKILVFDMAKLDFISSAGLSSLFRVQKTMKSRGGGEDAHGPPAAAGEESLRDREDGGSRDGLP